jgi:3-hydroxyacyl-[acyl-carrier-protein] dehydratase
MNLDAIKAAIPHREPFLLVDEVVEQSENHIVCRKRFTGDEFWYRGHYPNFPLTPGVLLCEAAMQAGAVLLAAVKKVSGTVSSGRTANAAMESKETVPDTFLVAELPGGVPVVTRMNNVKFKQMVRPGDTIELVVEITERMAGVFFLAAKVTVGGKTAVTFDFACKLAQTTVQDI